MLVQNCNELTPDALTRLLKTRGALTSGEVIEITCSDDAYNRGNVANTARLMLHYSADAEGDRPASLFLKISKPDLHPELQTTSVHEVAFYRAMKERPHHVPIPRIYSAEMDADEHTSIVMQDLTATHFQKPLPIPPSNRHCEMIVESLARLHAYWWNAPELGVTLGERFTAEENAARIKRMLDTFPQFVDYLGDAMLPAQRRMFEKIFASDWLQRRANRLIEQTGVTLIHGDSHTGNVLLPRSDTDSVVLIDWHLWSIGVGTFDLAFLIALHWSPARRALREKPLVRRYYDTLIEAGVSGYSWDDCWDDYRSEVMIMMLIPIGQFRRGSPTGVIWFGLQDSWAAVEDLRCEDLL